MPRLTRTYSAKAKRLPVPHSLTRFYGRWAGILHNVGMVEPEKTINTAWRADYALHNAENSIDLLIEAKCLGSNLEKYSTVQQLLSYAFGFGVLKVVVTDGINWHFYSDFKPGNSVANAQFNLLHDNEITCALQLIQWLDAAHSGHGSHSSAAIAAATVIKATNHSTIQSPKPQPTTKSQPKKSKAEAIEFIEVSQLNLAALPTGQKPKQLRLPNGSIKTISTWKDILLEVCQMVLKTNSNISIPFPDKAGKSRFMFSSSKPEKGSSSISSYKGKAIFIGTHYSAAACIANALYALQQLPSNQKTTTLAVSF